MKRPWLIAGIVVAAAALAPLIIAVFIPWSGINCEHQDINIKTGQARYSRYLWFLKVSETTRETPLSAALHGEVVDVADTEPWHRVNTFSRGVPRSPHYVFHDALRQARQVGEVLALLDATPEQQRETARTILTLWQQTGQDSGADEYIQNLTEDVPSGDRGGARQ